MVADLAYDAMGRVTRWRSLVREDPPQPSRPYVTYSYEYLPDRTVRRGRVDYGGALDTSSATLTDQGEHVLESPEGEGEAPPRRWVLDQGREVRYCVPGRGDTTVHWDGSRVLRARSPATTASGVQSHASPSAAIRERTRSTIQSGSAGISIPHRWWRMAVMETPLAAWIRRQARPVQTYASVHRPSVHWQAAERLVRLLDDQARGWSTTYAELCVARERRELSALVAVARSRCLDDWRRELDRALPVLEEPGTADLVNLTASAASSARPPRTSSRKSQTPRVHSNANASRMEAQRRRPELEGDRPGPAHAPAEVREDATGGREVGESRASRRVNAGHDAHVALHPTSSAVARAPRCEGPLPRCSNVRIAERSGSPRSLLWLGACFG